MWSVREQRALSARIAGTFTPWSRGYRSVKTESYALKHDLERGAGGVYITNWQFKGAVRAAGWEPEDATLPSWRFRRLRDIREE